MAVTSMSNSSIGNGQERYNRASGVNSNLDWCGISTTATGNYADSDGLSWDYWIFKANSSVVVSKAGLIEFLVVGGGGSGAASNTASNVGGGGAGGCRVPFPGETIAAGTFAVTVGAGGASSGGAVNGNSGSNSSIGSDIVGLGGGYGGYEYYSGGPGGSGGGAGRRVDSQMDNAGPPLAGGGTYYQGFRGGQPTVNNSRGSSGGGAGAQGTDSVDAAGALAGGIGIITTIISDTIATAQSVGEVDSGNVYFGGGGGTALSGAGGLGGGTAGSADNVGSANAAANTGGGTGGADINDTTYSGIGGSGVVIVRTRV
jgi:hypothetical protein